MNPSCLIRRSPTGRTNPDIFSADWTNFVHSGLAEVSTRQRSYQLLDFVAAFRHPFFWYHCRLRSIGGKVSGASRRLLRKHPVVVKEIKQRWVKLRALASNDLFLRETEKLRKALDRTLKTDRRELERFFTTYRVPAGPRLAKARRHVDGPPTTPLRKLLRKYISYVSTYGVYMTFRKRDERFILRIFLPKGEKFHARLVNNNLQPVAEVPEHMFDVDNFELEAVKMPEHLEEHIKKEGTRNSSELTTGSSVRLSANLKRLHLIRTV